MTSLRRSRAARWAVPAAVATTIGLIGFLPTLSSAAAPDLPPLTAQQLIEKVQQSQVEAFSGTFALTADLGIPSLSSIQAQGSEQSGFNPLDLLSGTHEVDIKADGPERQRVVQRSELSEHSVWHNGRDVWTWQSEGQKVTHLILPEHERDAQEAPAAAPVEPVPTPAELATQFLDEVNPSTNVSVTTPAYVAGRAVYSLVLAPKAAESTVDHVAMSVDAATGMPLEVEVTAKGKEKPALKLGFSSISFDRPSGPFTFTPPPGAEVTTKDIAKEKAEHEAKRALGPDAEPNSTDEYTVVAGGSERWHRFDEPGIVMTPDPAAASDEPTTVGEAWSTVVIVPGVEVRPYTEEAELLERATTQVAGPFGTARLLKTSLVNALLLPDGRVFAGFVTPQALQAAASGN